MLKSMSQMHDEMLKKCRFDGSFPKPVIMGLGCVALAYDQVQYDRLCAEADSLFTFMGWGIAIISVGMLIAFLYILVTSNV